MIVTLGIVMITAGMVSIVRQCCEASLPLLWRSQIHWQDDTMLTKLLTGNSTNEQVTNDGKQL